MIIIKPFTPSDQEIFGNLELQDQLIPETPARPAALPDVADFPMQVTSIPAAEHDRGA
jgi:hypothetical protein